MKNSFAVTFHDERLTPAQVSQSLGAMQSFFLSLKEEGRGLVAVLMDRGPELFITLNAAYLAGVPYIPLDPTHPADRINLILEEAGPDLILTDKHLLDKFPVSREKVIVSDILRENGEKTIEPIPVETDPESPVYTIFTSGSTGKPKGVVIPRCGLDNLLVSMAKEPGVTSGDRILALTTVSFDMSVPEVFLSLHTGAEMIILDKDSSRDPQAIIRALEEHDITFMQATPATWRMMIEEGWKGKENLRALCGGEAFPTDLTDDLVDRCGELWNMYGPTETTVWSTTERVRKNRPVSIGLPLDNTDIYVLDEELNPVDREVEGDLYIGGKGLALGYYNRPDLTSRVFIPSPFKEGETIYKTGDLARYRTDGRLECLGRSDFQVKIRGFRIELGEIESRLLSYEGILNAVVHSQEIRHGMKELVAYIVSDRTIDRGELVTYLSKSLTDYMIPSYFEFMESLPLSSNGKINRKALPVPQVKNVVDDREMGSSSLEEKLLYVWKKVLFRKEIKPEENFFEIGGNSILAVQALRETNELCESSLSLTTFFKYPVISELIDEITKNDVKEETFLHLNDVSEGTPLFCLGGIDLYNSLARFITDRPVYAVYLPYEEQLIDHIQRDALDEWEYMTVKGMADAYLREIRKHFPQGPCHLLGASIAGMIAFEASRTIHREEGERGELFILDSHLPRAKQLSFTGLLYSRARRLKNRKPKLAVDRKASLWDTEYIVAMRDSISERAEETFDKEAQPIEGDVHLVKAAGNQYGRGETWKSDLGWTALVSGAIHYCELPDDHLGILKEPCVETLADYLREKMT